MDSIIFGTLKKKLTPSRELVTGNLYSFSSGFCSFTKTGLPWDSEKEIYTCKVWYQRYQRIYLRPRKKEKLVLQAKRFLKNGQYVGTILFWFFFKQFVAKIFQLHFFVKKKKRTKNGKKAVSRAHRTGFFLDLVVFFFPCWIWWWYTWMVLMNLSKGSRLCRCIFRWYQLSPMPYAGVGFIPFQKEDKRKTDTKHSWQSVALREVLTKYVIHHIKPTVVN